MSCTYCVKSLRGRCTDYISSRRLPTVVLRWNYQIKNDERKISSESINLLSRPSEKPWFSLIELALFEKLDLELYLMKSVNRNLRFAVFLVFPKNRPLRRLRGSCLFYDQLIFYISATLCAIFMTLASKLRCPQWADLLLWGHFTEGQNGGSEVIRQI